MSVDNWALLLSGMALGSSLTTILNVYLNGQKGEIMIYSDTLPLVCFPMRIDWDCLNPPVAVTYPAPSQPARSMPIESWPGPVEQLAALAGTLGWTIEAVKQARGHLPHSSYGTPSAAEKTSWSIRMSRGQERAVAVRMDAAWTSFWHWSPVGRMLPAKNLTEFRAMISTHSDLEGSLKDLA